MASTSQMVPRKGYKQAECVCKLCKKRFTKFYILHEPVVCKKCGEYLSKTLGRSSGVIHAHGKEHYVCNICVRFHKSLSDLNRHVASHLNKRSKLYLCLNCTTNFGSLSTLNRHKRTECRTFYTRLNEHLFFCYTCGKMYKSKNCFEKHKNLEGHGENKNMQSGEKEEREKSPDVDKSSSETDNLKSDT